MPAEASDDRARVFAEPVYVEARRVLLDALAALSEHTSALTLVGAQAVYLRVGAGDLAVAPYTTDGDLALDPRHLGPEPELEAAMTAAGFHPRIIGDRREPGIWVTTVEVNGEQFVVPVDLIVPAGIAPPGGTRGARLGLHGNRAARRADGLEAALIDRSPMTITALDPSDGRTATINVAGVAALLVAKAHKIRDRVASGRPGRVGDKDGADVVRMMQGSSPRRVVSAFRELMADEIAGPASRTALEYLDELFGRAGRPGIQMAARALSIAMNESEVEGLCVAYVRALRDAIPGERHTP